MVTNFYELETTLKYLGAKWLMGKKIISRPGFSDLTVTGLLSINQSINQSNNQLVNQSIIYLPIILGQKLSANLLGLYEESP